MRRTNCNRPVSVAALRLETPEEHRLFKKGEENYQAKKALRSKSLLEKAPIDEESDLIHSMWTKEISYLRKSSYYPSWIPPSSAKQKTN